MDFQRYTASTAAESRAARPHFGVIEVVAVVLPGLCALIAGYQPLITYQVDLSHVDKPDHLVSGAYPRESANGVDYRWSQKDVTLAFDGIPQNVSQRLNVMASAGSRPAEAPPAVMAVTVNGRTLDQVTVGPEMRGFAFDLPTDVIREHHNLLIELNIVPFNPGQYGSGDRRELGLVLDEISLEPVAVQGPLALPAWDALIAVMVGMLFARALGAGRMPLLILNLSLLAGVIFERPLVTATLPYIAVLLGAVWVGYRLAPQLANWIASSVFPAHLRLLRVVVTVLAVLGSATTSWSVLSYDIGKFMPAGNPEVMNVDELSLAYNDVLQYIRTQTPRNIELQVDPTLAGSDFSVGLLAERMNYYYYDQVFAYQFPTDRLNTRRGNIEHALLMPTLNEACNRFHNLKIDILLLEKKSAYPWLADLNEPKSCFKKIYENRLVILLQLAR